MPTGPRSRRCAPTSGPVMPHAGTIERLVQGAIDGSLGPPLEKFDPDVLALPGRLDGHPVL